MAAAPLTDSWTLGGLTVPNRVTLAPLAGIGNWVVRLQAKRFGAGYAVSEMVSSFAIHHRNEKTLRDLLRFEEAERDGGPVAIQLFGQDPEVMRSAAAYVAEHVAVDVIDLNMGCPVPKVVKTGAGAAMLKDPDTAVAVARAAREGSGLPVTVKLRSATKKDGEADGYALASRLVDEAGVAGIGFHPRSAQVHHKGTPDYELAAKLVQELPVPIVLSGGLHDDAQTIAAYEQVAPAAVMLDRTIEHLGEERAGRYLRKHYPWYVERLAEAATAATGGDQRVLPDKELQAALQSSADVEAARALVRGAAATTIPA